MLGITRITTTIPIVKNEESSFEEIVNSVIDTYSTRQGYYFEEKENTNEDIIRQVCLGTDNGAEGISVFVELYEDKIEVEERGSILKCRGGNKEKC